MIKKMHLTKKLTFFIRLDTFRVFIKDCVMFECFNKCLVADNILRNLVCYFSLDEN